MKDWFKSLLTSCSKVSSKRIVAIFVTINLIVLSYIATFSKNICPIAMFDTLALLTGGLFGGTVIEKFTKKTKNGESNGSEKNSGGDL
jgi:general stress protein CsbA